MIISYGSTETWSSDCDWCGYPGRGHSGVTLFKPDLEIVTISWECCGCIH